MTARVKRTWAHSLYRGVWYLEWFCDPVLAIGGAKHGLTLPAICSPYNNKLVVDVVEPIAFYAAEIPQLPETVTGHRQVYTPGAVQYPVGQHQIHWVPIYLGPGAEPSEAVEMVQLIFLWNLLYVQLQRLGVLQYFIAVREMRETFRRIEEMAAWQQDLKRLRDELDP